MFKNRATLGAVGNRRNRASARMGRFAQILGDPAPAL